MHFRQCTQQNGLRVSINLESVAYIEAAADGHCIVTFSGGDGDNYLHLESSYDSFRETLVCLDVP